ncbi:MAG: exodeoxyribonuclease VII small subunit [bacterium]|nr:exodeoxyribonuclease VII small subunit [bacterium]
MPPKKTEKKIDVEKGFSELEEITSWFEEGGGDLDEGLKKFERAVTLANDLKNRLKEAENTIQDIKKSFED